MNKTKHCKDNYFSRVEFFFYSFYCFYFIIGCTQSKSDVSQARDENTVRSHQRYKEIGDSLSLFHIWYGWSLFGTEAQESINWIEYFVFKLGVHHIVQGDITAGSLGGGAKPSILVVYQNSTLKNHWVPASKLSTFSLLVGLGVEPGTLPFFVSLQYRILHKSMYWFPPPFQLPVTMQPIWRCWV